MLNSFNYYYNVVILYLRNIEIEENVKDNRRKETLAGARLHSVWKNRLVHTIQGILQVKVQVTCC